MPISVSPEAEAKARQIPDFSARLDASLTTSLT